MSVEQRELIQKSVQWLVKVLFLVIGWFLVNSFMEVKGDIKEIKTDIKLIEGRMIKVETKIER